MAFSFSMLGAFLVRSGVLTSVQDFAVDPTRGVMLLASLGVAAGVGNILLGSASAQEPAILSFAAGAVLAMLAEAMIPEAFENAPPFIGLITVLGYLAAYLIAQP